MAVSFEGINMLSPELQRAYQTAVKAEQKPIQTLQQQKGKIEERVKLLNDVVGKVDAVKGMLPGLNTPIAIRELAFSSTDEKAITGTVDKSRAVPGEYNVEVMSLATAATALSNRFEDKDKTTVGSGYFTFVDANGREQEVFIDDGNGTLDGIAKIINQSRTGMKASVINDRSDPEAPYRLLLTATGTGSDNNVTFPEFYFSDGPEDFYIEEEKPASNGMIRYEGHEIEIPSNEINDLIPGTSIHLRGVSEPGRPTQLTIAQDIPKTTVKVKDLVDKLNGVFSFIQQQNTMDEKTDTSKTLGGEYSLRVSEQRLRSALSQNFFGDPEKVIRTMNDVGIQFQRGGLLAFDEKKFQAALARDFDQVVDLFTGDGFGTGVIPALSRALTSLSGPEGAVLSNQKKTETGKVDRIDKEIERKEKIADKKAEDLKMKLARTQSAITAIQRQGQQLSGMGGGGNPVAQLLGG